MRTAGKLTPFHFNEIPKSDDLDAHLALEKRQKKYNLKTDVFLPPGSFCPVCNSPLNKSDSINSCDDKEFELTGERFATMCCSSCQFQILPKGPVEQFYSILPHQIIERAKDHSLGKHRLLREQIQDCLLPEGKDEV